MKLGRKDPRRRMTIKIPIPEELRGEITIQLGDEKGTSLRLEEITSNDMPVLSALTKAQKAFLHRFRRSAHSRGITLHIYSEGFARVTVGQNTGRLK